jgi:2-polyprenyl-3-methyl-5-hydroxy-6-metoxy-1,4-benzoquinol methylase
MDSDYAASYRTLYQNHWWWRAREAAVVRVLQEHCSADSRRRILDIGCGDGLLFDKLAPWGDVEGVEICRELISSDNPWRSKIYLGPFDELYQPARKYGLILMLDVLEHFADPLAALRHASRLLEPNGLLLIHVPAFPALWTSHDDFNHHYTRYTQRSLRHVLRQAAYDVSQLQYTFYWTCPVKLAIRAKERLLATSSKPAAVPPSWVNTICYQLCRLEQRLFHSCSPGFGSSILALARPTELCDDTESLAREGCGLRAGV